MTLIVLQVVVLLAVSPFIVGLIRKVKATLQCRRGASVVQPHYDLLKLFQKDVVVSSNASWIFTATPYILFASTLAANLLVPLFVSKVPLSFAGDIITVVYLLALGTFFLILAGLDTGSAFGGMGSSREAIVASLTEPAMILSIFAVGLTAGSTNAGAFDPYSIFRTVEDLFGLEHMAAATRTGTTSFAPDLLGPQKKKHKKRRRNRQRKLGKGS